MAKETQDYVIEWLEAHGPDEWHRVATTWNWDAGYRILNWIVDQPRCDKGTVVHLFWLGSPDAFLKFRNRDEVLATSRWNIENFDFLERVLKHWRAGRYKTALFASEGVTEAAQAYGHVESHMDPASLPWTVPADMRRDVEGRVLDTKGYAEGYSPTLAAKLKAAGVPF